MPSITSAAFSRLVNILKKRRATITVVESCCGGLISASILAQPGASAVYFGGSVAYNTRRSKPILLNDEALHKSLIKPVENNAESEVEQYIQSKLAWTSQTATAYCIQVGTDFCIAEGGAAGPTFRPKGLHHGFSVIAVAARDPTSNDVSVVRQEVIHSSHANRQINMRFFADTAATITVEVLGESVADERMESTVSEPKQVLDRATSLRSQPEQLNLLSFKAKYVVLHKNMSLFRKNYDTSGPLLAYLSQKQVDQLCRASGLVQVTSFLGLLNGHEPVFGVDLIGDAPSESIIDIISNMLPASSGSVSWEETRTAAPLLSPATCDNELVLYATALAQWQRRNPYCSSCGGKTVLLDGGTSRQCSSCGHRSWPRQDPSIIVAVSSRDREHILLARSKRHPPRMHTTLAGFVEAGETMEAAVAREVYEETGIRIDKASVEYVATQPWPFPQSTMIGFMATADESQGLNIDRAELVEAAWFTKDQVRSAMQVPGAVMQHEVAMTALQRNPELELLIPPKGVIARRLIEEWLHR